MAKGKGKGKGKGKAEAVAAVKAKAALEARFSAAIRGGGGDGSGAGAGAAAGVRAGAGLRPPGDAQEAATLQAALFESAQDAMQQEADDAAVDQLIRHAESGFFGGEDPDFEWRVGDY